MGGEIDEAGARARTGQTSHGASEMCGQRGTHSLRDGGGKRFCGMDRRTRFLTTPTAYLERWAGFREGIART